MKTQNIAFLSTKRALQYFASNFVNIDKFRNKDKEFDSKFMMLSNFQKNKFVRLR
jgi:hypothetical protein